MKVKKRRWSPELAASRCQQEAESLAAELDAIYSGNKHRGRSHVIHSYDQCKSTNFKAKSSSERLGNNMLQNKYIAYMYV